MAWHRLILLGERPPAIYLGLGGPMMRYLGRFLIDDTGRLIKGNIIDIWMPTCREARLFGRQNGTAVLVPREPTPTLAGRAR